jgi:ABC-type transport system involved in multi-copper enzyme maturation permease subunit
MEIKLPKRQKFVWLRFIVLIAGCGLLGLPLVIFMLICGLFRIWSRLVNRVLGRPSFLLFRGMELLSAKLGFSTTPIEEDQSLGVPDASTPPEPASAQPEASA